MSVLNTHGHSITWSERALMAVLSHEPDILFARRTGTGYS